MSPMPRLPSRPCVAPSSPLMLCDRLLTLAQDADRAGYAATAEHLLELVDGVFEERPRRPLRQRLLPSGRRRSQRGLDVLRAPAREIQQVGNSAHRVQGSPQP